MLGRKVIYVRCINCSYNNVAKGIRLLDKKATFVYTGIISCKEELLKVYPLNSFIDTELFNAFFDTEAPFWT